MNTSTINKDDFQLSRIKSHNLGSLNWNVDCTVIVNKIRHRKIHCGDCIALFTPNLQSEVDIVLKSLDLPSTTIITATGDRKPVWLGEKVELGDLLK